MMIFGSLFLEEIKYYLMNYYFSNLKKHKFIQQTKFARHMGMFSPGGGGGNMMYRRKTFL